MEMDLRRVMTTRPIIIPVWLYLNAVLLFI